MDLQEFEQQLRDLIGSPARLRPFVCEGSPLACRVVITGSNPATQVGLDFWDFWTRGYGFHKTAWREAYARERARLGKRPVSTTRRVIDQLTGAMSVPCLETNIYSSAADAVADLSPEERWTGPFDFLVDAIRPDVIVTYGKDAETHLEGWLGLGIPHETFGQVRVLGGRVWFRAERHFSRGYAYARAEQLGRDIDAVVQASV